MGWPERSSRGIMEGGAGVLAEMLVEMLVEMPAGVPVGVPVGVLMKMLTRVPVGVPTRTIPHQRKGHPSRARPDERRQPSLRGDLEPVLYVVGMQRGPQIEHLAATADRKDKRFPH